MLKYEDIAESVSSTKKGDKSEGNLKMRMIGDELRLVIQQMETKGDQITILRDIVTSSMAAAGSLKRPDRFQPTKGRGFEADTRSSLSRRANDRGKHGTAGTGGSLSLLKSTIKVQNALRDK